MDVLAAFTGGALAPIALAANIAAATESTIATQEADSAQQKTDESNPPPAKPRSSARRIILSGCDCASFRNWLPPRDAASGGARYGFGRPVVPVVPNLTPSPFVWRRIRIVCAIGPCPSSAPTSARNNCGWRGRGSSNRELSTPSRTDGFGGTFKPTEKQRPGGCARKSNDWSSSGTTIY